MSNNEDGINEGSESEIEPEQSLDKLQELADNQANKESTEKDTEKKPNSYSEKVGRK